jgi:hypothetical protein
MVQIALAYSQTKRQDFHEKTSSMIIGKKEVLLLE